MRLVLLLAACLLSGCTALGAGFAAEINRQHRADAQVDLAADSLLVPGDVLTVRLRSGRTLFGTVVSVGADTLRLDAGAAALADVASAERPWRHSSVGRATAVGAVLDAAALAFLWYAFSNLTFQGGFTF